LQHKTATRPKLAIAWRIMVLTLLGRHHPELPADMLLSRLEVEVLQAYAKRTASNDPCCSARLSASQRGWVATSAAPGIRLPATECYGMVMSGCRRFARDVN
jgi:hypothetical protein